MEPFVPQPHAAPCTEAVPSVGRTLATADTPLNDNPTEKHQAASETIDSLCRDVEQVQDAGVESALADALAVAPELANRPGRGLPKFSSRAEIGRFLKALGRMAEMLPAVGPEMTVREAIEFCRLLQVIAQVVDAKLVAPLLAYRRSTDGGS